MLFRTLFPLLILMVAVESDSKCCLRGDPHITTFDRRKYNFGGACNYTIVGPCENSEFEFRIDVDMDPRKVNKDQDRITGVRIENVEAVYAYSWSNKQCRNVIYVDGVQHNLTYSDEILSASVSGNEVTIKLIGDISILINCKFHAVCVSLPIELSDSGVCGLCGRFNEDSRDDTDCVINCPGNCAENDFGCDIDEFGELWKVENSCDL